VALTCAASAGGGALAGSRAAPVGDERAGGLRLSKVDDFNAPIYAHGPKGADGSLLFVVERAGEIKVLKNGERKGTFLDIKNKVSCCNGERGLYSVAFANWRKSRRFYVYYTDNGGDLVIREYRRRRNKPLRADRSTGRTLLEIEHSRYTNHNGGQLQWGPDDRLYIATGDGGGGGDPLENAQDKSSLLGKMLRINPLRNPKGRQKYGIPRDNPYVGRRGRNEVFSRGLRNPFRFSFDRKRIVIGDVGQDRFEEIDFTRLRQARGANYGWDNYEGNSIYEGPRLSDHERPVHTYSHSNGCSITGGYVVRDEGLGSLRKRYLYGDLCTGNIRSIKAGPRGASGDSATGLSRGGLVSFGVDSKRHVYVVAGGAVYRIRR
jgi:hypothetical protein